MAAPPPSSHSSLIYATVMAKIPGVNRPCKHRQNRSCPKLRAVAASSVGAATRKAAQTIAFLRPNRGIERQKRAEPRQHDGSRAPAAERMRCRAQFRPFMRVVRHNVAG